MSSTFVPVIRPFTTQDFAAMEAIYREQKSTMLRERIRRAIGRWLARPLLSALYITLAVLLSAYGVQLALYPMVSIATALGISCVLHVVFVGCIALFVRLRHRRDVDVAVKLDLGLRLQRYSSASSSWHLLLVALAPPAAQSSKLIGWIGATFSPVHNSAVIDTLAVDIAYRRRGVARQLLVAAERAATLRSVRRFEVVLRAPRSASLTSTLLLCAADDLAPDANLPSSDATDADALAAATGDDIVCDRPAAMLFHQNGFRPSKRLESNSTTTDAFELWRKSLDQASDKPHNE
jgi:GNAT superfamily N-acetyltransferase